MGRQMARAYRGLHGTGGMTMLIEKQTGCRYCCSNHCGRDFSVREGDVIQLIRRESGVYYISAYSDNEDDSDNTYCIDSKIISYCPMCGRKLAKENN